MKQYEKYKPSGIEWLGEIPEHWEVKRVKDCSEINKLALSDKTAYDYQFKYVDIGNVNQNGIIQEPELIIFEEAPSRARRIVKENDVIISTVRTYLKAIAFFNFDPINYIVSTGFAVLTHKSNVNPKFLSYHSQSECFIDSVIRNSTGVSYPAINSQAIAALHVIFPTFSEQTSIAKYLDTKTTAIDRKIELLTAKADKYKALRRSLINETVCRGLNPNASLKDSGIEWIGKIPEHWEVKRLKALGEIETSSVDKKTIADEALVKLVNYTDIYGNKSKEIWNSDNFMIVSANDKQLKSKKINSGDVLFTPSSETIDDIGVSAVVMEDLNNTLYSYHILRFKFNKFLDLNFKKYMLNNDFVQYYFSKSASGSTRKILGLNIFWNLHVILPPLTEQIAIGKYLDEKTTQIDTILINISEQITKLTQLRKTLINDVVTGKIKVTE